MPRGPKQLTKLTTPNLQRVLDTLLTVPDWRKAMSVIRASESLAFSWRSKSIEAAKANDTSSIFFVEWRGAYDYWHNHAGRARTENVILYESVIRHQALHGIEVPVLGPDQRPVYVEDPDLIDIDDETLWRIYGRRNRYLLDDKKRPVPLTKTEQLPAPLRLRVLEQNRAYVARQEIDTKISGEITVAKPLQRLPGEERPIGTLEKLKRLAAMSPEQRRAELGASRVPLDTMGRVTRADTGAPLAIGDNRADDGPELAKPGNPRAYQEAKLNPPTRPSYARPDQSLDHGEGTGRGDIPDGGMKVV
jgi:hypothetical protein